MPIVALPVVRPMRVEDVARVRAIDALVYPELWSEKLLRDEVDRDDRSHVVIEVDDVVVGHAGMLFVEPEATLTTIAVDPGVQGRALATRMLLHLTDTARERGIEAITLEVRAGNRRAQRLYGRFGFAPVGIRKGYYRPNNEDAVIMWVHDVHTDEYCDRLDRLRPDVGPDVTGIRDERTTRVG